MKMGVWVCPKIADLANVELQGYFKETNLWRYELFMGIILGIYRDPKPTTLMNLLKAGDLHDS